MSANPGQRASDLAAEQVEQIVSAAHAAAEEMRNEAELDSRDIRSAAQREGQEAVESARRSVSEELAKARKQAIVLGRDARRDADALLGDAKEEADEIREKARRAVDGRVAAAERAAAEVLEEARALSSGLHQLGKALEDHAERILRDVTAAHKRMRSELRVGGALGGVGETRVAGPGSEGHGPNDPGSSEVGATSRPKRRNPFEEIEVPPWVGPEG